MSEKPNLRVILCSPRGFCAGVTRAIDVVETALKLHGAPVYVRHEIVHNKYVVDSLKAKGAIFIKELDEAPAGDAPVIFSAHGVPKSVPAEAERRSLNAIDATCPLVTKVHREAQAHFKRGRHIILIGHAGHPEVVGTLGQLPAGAITLVGDARRGRDAATSRGQGARLRHPDHAVGRRHARSDCRVESEVPAYSGAAGRGHLLRHHQPPGGGEGRGASGRRRHRRRRRQFLQFAAPARSRRARGLQGFAAGAERRGARFRQARRRQVGRDHRRRLGAGNPGRTDPRRSGRALYAGGRDTDDARREHVFPVAAHLARDRRRRRPDGRLHGSRRRRARALPCGL